MGVIEKRCQRRVQTFYIIVCELKENIILKIV